MELEILLWALVAAETVLFGYILQFTQATLQFGRALGDGISGRGLQDAITPPWQTNVALATYTGVLLLPACLWYRSGWPAGLGAFALIVVVGGATQKLMPKADGPHFRWLILRSMVSRHADYVRDGDTLRAQAMGELLAKVGLPPPSRQD
jgi:hypothetical protein